MKQLSKTQSILMLIGACLMVVGAGLYVFGGQVVGNVAMNVAPAVFAPGTLLFATMQAMQRYEGTNVTVRRLRRIMLMGAALFVVSALLMAENSYHVVYPLFLNAGIDGYNAYLKYVHNNWVVTLLVAAILQLYSTHRISSELGKTNASAADGDNA